MRSFHVQKYCETLFLLKRRLWKTFANYLPIYLYIRPPFFLLFRERSIARTLTLLALVLLVCSAKVDFLLDTFPELKHMLLIITITKFKVKFINNLQISNQPQPNITKTCLTGSSINDITQIWTIFNPLPPSSSFLLNGLSTVVTKFLTPSPWCQANLEK